MKHLRRYIARTVVVHTDGPVFQGTLANAYAEGLVIDRPTVLGPTGGPLDGQVVVNTAAVTWVQVV